MFITPTNINRVLPLTVTIACLVAAAVFASRAFFIGYACALAFCLLDRQQFQVDKRRLLVITLLLGSLAIVLMLFIKRDSSLGRLLIYKISCNMLKDHFITGIGWGHFGVYYSNYQAAYFKAGHFTTKELLLADNVDCLYNDYLQFIIETGIAGLFVLTIVLIMVIRLFVITIRKYHSVPLPAVLSIAMCQVLAIGTAALFRFVFIDPFFLCLLLVALVIIYSYYQWGKIRWAASILPALVIVFGVMYYHYGQYVIRHKHYHKYRQARMLAAAGYRQEALLVYRKLYPVLKEDNAFSRDYISALIQSGDCNKAIDEIKRVLTKTSNYIIYTQLADCCYKTGRFAEAESAYRQAVYLVPNRFTSRFNLFNYYQQTGQDAKALETGKDLLSMPVKIPSLQVSYIRNTVRNRINQPNNHTSDNQNH
jgi:tetratricopeptide (TPR) repeat protein